MAYPRIFWKDRIVVLNEDGTIQNIIQEGTPLSAFNLNHMEEGIVKASKDTDLIKKNQLELLIARDLAGERLTMNEGYWFDSLKNESKVVSKVNTSIAENKLGLTTGQAAGSVTFGSHDIDFKTNKTTYYHKRKSQFATLQSAKAKTTSDNTVEVVSEIITITY